MGSTFSTVANKGHLDDFAIGMAVGAVSGYAGGSIAGGMARGMGMNMAGIGVAAMRGGLAGAISGGGMAAIYNQDIGKGALMGAAVGAAMGSAVWAKNAYTTNQFLKNNVSWDSSVSASDRDTFTQAIKEAGQSPLGQELFSKYRGSGQSLAIHSTTGGPYSLLGTNNIYLNSDTNSVRSMVSSYDWATTTDQATLLLHEMGHTDGGFGNGREAIAPFSPNVADSENPYRGWIGAVRRSEYAMGIPVNIRWGHIGIWR